MKLEYVFENRININKDNKKNSNEICIGTGDCIKAGSFDHHLSDEGSTSEILLEHATLLRETKDAIKKDETVKLVLPENPGTDSIIAAYMIIDYLNSDEETFVRKYVNRGTPGRKLAAFATEVNSGKGKNVTKLTLYNLICNLDLNPIKDALDNKEKKLEIAFKFVSKALKIIEENPETDIENCDLYSPGENAIADVIKDNIDKHTGFYEEDKASGRLVIKKINIWDKDGNIINVPAAVWSDIPKAGGNAAQIAREKDNVAVTFTPHNDPGDQGQGVRISINPSYEKAGACSLFEVAEMMEWMEQIYEKRLFETSGLIRRDYSRPRTSDPGEILGIKPFSATSDPWYVMPKGDMVDTPRQGSLIPIPVMISILENITLTVTTYAVDYYQNDNGSSLPYAIDYSHSERYESLWRWSYRTRKYNESDRYRLFVVHFNPGIISDGYDILSSYYAGLDDRILINLDEKEMLHINSRVHLYANEKKAVLFIASDIGYPADIENTVIDMFSRALAVKYNYNGILNCDFNGFYGDIRRKKSTAGIINNVNTLACKMPIVRNFIVKAFNIEELKSETIDKLKLAAGNSTEKKQRFMVLLLLIIILMILFLLLKGLM